MADYMTIPIDWSCECGASGCDIVPFHNCPIQDCVDCGKEYNSKNEGDDEICQTCLDELMDLFEEISPAVNKWAKAVTKNNYVYAKKI